MVMPGRDFIHEQRYCLDILKAMGIQNKVQDIILDKLVKWVKP